MKNYVISLFLAIMKNNPRYVYMKLCYLADALEDRLTQDQKRATIEILDIITDYIGGKELDEN